MTTSINNNAELKNESGVLIISRAFMVNGKSYDVTIEDSECNLGYLAGNGPDVKRVAETVKIAVCAYFEELSSAWKSNQGVDLESVEIEFDTETNTSKITSHGNTTAGTEVNLAFDAFAKKVNRGGADTSFAQAYTPVGTGKFTLDHATKYLVSVLKCQRVAATNLQTERSAKQSSTTPANVNFNSQHTPSSVDPNLTVPSPSSESRYFSSVSSAAAASSSRGTSDNAPASRFPPNHRMREEFFEPLFWQNNEAIPAGGKGPLIEDITGQEEEKAAPCDPLANRSRSPSSEEKSAAAVRPVSPVGDLDDSDEEFDGTLAEHFKKLEAALAEAEQMRITQEQRFHRNI